MIICDKCGEEGAAGSNTHIGVKDLCENCRHSYEIMFIELSERLYKIKEEATEKWFRKEG